MGLKEFVSKQKAKAVKRWAAVTECGFAFCLKRSEGRFFSDERKAVSDKVLFDESGV